MNDASDILEECMSAIADVLVQNGIDPDTHSVDDIALTIFVKVVRCVRAIDKVGK